MNNRVFVAIEFILLAIAIIFGVLWIAYPENNYEPFTVIPVLFIGVLEIIKRSFSKRKSINKVQIENSKEKENEEVIPEKKISNITVDEIINTINTSAPLMKEEMEKKYNGIRVKWTGYLKTAKMAGQDKVRVNINIEKDSIIGKSIWFTENIEKIPEIKTLEKESEICVLGDIISASGAGISVTLKPVDIEIK